MSGTIYIIYCKTLNKNYIGKTTETLQRRFRRHIVDKNKSCRMLADAIEKYGENDFTINSLATNINEDMLNFYENKYILEYNTLHPNGLNLQSGGSNGFCHNQDTIEKMSLAQKGRVITEDAKEKISISNKFKMHTEESKEKMKNYEHKRNNDSDVLKNALDILKIEQLPKYIQFHKNGEYIEVRIPNVKRKTFKDKNISLDKRIIDAIKYKNDNYNSELDTSRFNKIEDEDLKNLNIVLKELDINRLPKYIYFHKINNLYRITVKISDKKEKTFSSKKMPLKTKLENAIKYLNLQS